MPRLRFYTTSRRLPLDSALAERKKRQGAAADESFQSDLGESIVKELALELVSSEVSSCPENGSSSANIRKEKIENLEK